MLSLKYTIRKSVNFNLFYLKVSEIILFQTHNYVLIYLQNIQIHFGNNKLLL